MNLRLILLLFFKYLLAKSIEAMSKADAVVFMKGWQEARGCRIEHQIAIDYGKFVMEL